MVRKFLYFITFCIILVIVGLMVFRIWGVELIRWWSVPTVEFKQVPPVAQNRYADPAMWFSRPGLADGDPSRWLPQGFSDGDAQRGNAAIFYIHPTSYLNSASWNAPLEDQEGNDRAKLFLRGQSSAFSLVGDVWAPRYRQATFGVFLTTDPRGGQALEAAYRDVEAAFDQFISEISADRPIILAGHSQGSLHLTTLLRNRVADKPLAKRIVAAYAVGWPISVDADLQALGLPACQKPDQAGCILSWLSYAEPADTEMVTETYDASAGYSGKPRRGTDALCVNPITGTLNGEASTSSNLGTLVSNADLTDGSLTPKAVPARCGPRGFLLIGDPPEVGSYVLPGNNYHVYDYSLFWANIRADAARRLAAFEAK